jgi:hypothetical protein
MEADIHTKIWGINMSNYVATFDGVDDYIKVNQPEQVTAIEGITLCSWVVGSGYVINIAPTEQLALSIGSNVLNFITPSGTLSSNISWASGVWHHIAGKFDGSSKTLYVDGTKVATTNGSETFQIMSDIYIGAKYDISNFFTGKINDVRIYERSLSDNDIYNVYMNEDDTNTGRVIFKGIVENIDYQAQAQTSNVSVRGRDYGSVLQDLTIPPEVYTDKEVSYIIIDLMKKYCTELTYNNVNYTSVTLPRIAFNHESLFQALKRLSTLTAFSFYVDDNKDLHFEERTTNNSGYTFDKTNTIKTTWKTTRQEMANSVWVYGDRFLSGWKELFSAYPLGSTLYPGSSSPSGGFVWRYDGTVGSFTGSTYVPGSYIATGSISQYAVTGSVYTLQYRPSNTNVEVNGVIKFGGVDQMYSATTSGVQYLVNYQDKAVIFTSGTQWGSNLPSTGSILIVYDRDLPIIKVGQDRASIDFYGMKEKIIMNKAIKDADEAEDLMRNTLNEESNPKTEGMVQVRGYIDVEPGQYGLFNYPKEGIGSKTYDIISNTYNLNKADMYIDDFQTLKVNRRIKNITDELVSMKEDLQNLQAGEVASSDLLSRFEFGAGSIGIKQHWQISAKSIGSAFIISSLTNAKLGICALGSANISDWVVQASGGEW